MFLTGVPLGASAATLASPTTDPSVSGCYHSEACPNPHMTVSDSNGTQIALGVFSLGPVALNAAGVYQVSTSAPQGIFLAVNLQPAGIGTLDMSTVTTLMRITNLENGSSILLNPEIFHPFRGWGLHRLSLDLFGEENLREFWGSQLLLNMRSEMARFLEDFLGGSFNPDIPGRFDIKFTLSNIASWETLNSVSITVVRTNPPLSVSEPSPLYLLGLGAFGLLALRTRHKKN